MGLGGISVWQLLIILAIVVLLFGTKRLRGIGGDLGSAVRGFRNAMQDSEGADTRQQVDVGDRDSGHPEVETNDSRTA